MSNSIRVVLVIAVVLGAGLMASPASAASNQVKTLSRFTAGQLRDIREQMQSKEYKGALEDLRSLADDVADEPYALAITQRLMAYAYISLKNYDKALVHFRKAVELHALPEKQQQQATYSLAQLYVATKHYRKALDLLLPWFEKVKNPQPNAYVMAAQSYYQLDKLKNARAYIKKAIKAGDKPHKTWYTMLVGIDYRLKFYDEAIHYSKKLITYWPDEGQYWRHLYGLYLMQGKSDKALPIMQIAYKQGFIEDANDLLNLARLEIKNGFPYYGAKIITKGMEKGTIDKSLENYRLLITAWTQAREKENALNAMTRAAQLADTGKIYLRKAQLCFNRAMWSCTVEAAENAVEKGGLETPGNAWLFKGMALAQAKKLSKAKQALKKAEDFEETEKSAKKYIKYIKHTLAPITG